MALFKYATRTRQGTCPAHGQVKGEKQMPKLTFPFVITGAARGLTAVRAYRCPDCGAKLT